MNILEARNITKSYRNLVALNDASLVVGLDEIHGLIGPNGSGKSTLMKCLAGAEKASSGSIWFEDADITLTSPRHRARQGISIKFQLISVLPELSVVDNVLLAMQASNSLKTLLFSGSRNRLYKLAFSRLEDFRLRDRANDLAGALSHGQQQWLEIAMALAVEPRLLLLDEPTAGMSFEERRITGELIRASRMNCSIVIVEHDLDFIRDLCDRVTVLDQGKVLATGTVKEVQRNSQVQEVYLRRG